MKNARRAAAAGHKTTQRRRRPPVRRRTALLCPAGTPFTSLLLFVACDVMVVYYMQHVLVR